MKDCLKREIQVGSYIAYAMTQGRSACMRFYRVIGTSSHSISAEKFHGFDSSGKPTFRSPVQLTGGDRAMMIHESELDTLKP